MNAPTKTANKPKIQSTSELLLGIWKHLSRRRQIQLLLLLVVMLCSGLAEMGSLGAVLPFLTMLSDPEKLWGQPLVQPLSQSMGIYQAKDLILPVTLVFSVSALLAGLIRLGNLWLNGRLAAAIGSELSCDVYRRTLYQPYEVHLNRNSSEVITATTTHIAATVSALTAFLQLLTATVVALGLLTGLFLIDWIIALSAAALFGSTYCLLAITSRKELRMNSQRIAVADREQIKALQEGLGGIREVLLNGNQHTYVSIYRQADLPKHQLRAKNSFLAIFPRYGLEALALVGIALLGGLLVINQGGGYSVIPLLGAMALGAQRLLPALQQIYGGWTSVKAFNASLIAILDMLNQPMPPLFRMNKPLVLRKSIRLESVRFGYNSDNPEVLKDLDLEIFAGEKIGLIGSTGSGKSTAIDLIMGLLAPRSGCVQIDGENLHDPRHPERIAAWRAAIAHVPQSIYLADSSVAENIAFGVSKQAIDMDRVRIAANQAQIANYIENTPMGYGSFVGERGIRLSGGQRQRIGIARALYKDAKILVLDEATSALDSKTEEAVMAAIDSLNQQLTIIMIAHRLTTVKRCDRLIRLTQGRISAVGLPHEVLSDVSLN